MTRRRAGSSKGSRAGIWLASVRPVRCINSICICWICWSSNVRGSSTGFSRCRVSKTCARSRAAHGLGRLALHAPADFVAQRGHAALVQAECHCEFVIHGRQDLFLD